MNHFDQCSHTNAQSENENRKRSAKNKTMHASVNENYCEREKRMVVSQSRKKSYINDKRCAFLKLFVLFVKLS